MPTNYSFQFYVMDPGNPPARGTTLNPQTLTATDTNDDGFIRPNVGDTVGGFQVSAVWVGDTITVRVGGVDRVITGVTFYRVGAPAVFTPTDGSNLVSSSFRSSTFVQTSTEYQVGPIPCFVAGTLISTPHGPRAVEDLRPGDLVLTRDHGPRPLAWVGARVVPGLGRHAPVRFMPGAFGNVRALLVSPQHRIVMGGWQAELYCGVDEVLVAARLLLNGDTIHSAPMPQVRYVHLMFDRHEVIFAEGIATESFHPGAYILAGDAALRAEIVGLFPELEEPDSAPGWIAARPIATEREAALLRMA